MIKEAERIAFETVRAYKNAADGKAAAVLAFLRSDKKYSELESERDVLAFEYARLVSQKTETGDLNSRINKLNDELKTRLSELAASESDLVPRYHCRKCNDTGIYDKRTCVCVKALTVKIIQKQSGALITDEKDFHACINAPLPSQKHKDFYSFLSRFSDDFPNTPFKLIGVLGAVGTGKSYAVSVLTNKLIERGFFALMLNAQELNKIFLKYHLARLEDKNEIFETLTAPDILVIDDLGAENLIDKVTLNYLYNLLTERQKSFTAFTSNLSVEAIEDRYGQRIFSRLLDKHRSAYFLLEGSDLRISP